jgi:hypothetical protein
VSEPAWITDREAVALNHRLIALFGGLGAGARDEKSAPTECCPVRIIG